MGKNIKKLGISLLLVICSGMGLHWYSNIEAHPKSVVSSETDIKSDKPIGSETEVINDEQKANESVKSNNENLNISKTEDNTLKEDENLNNKKELTIEESNSVLKKYNSNVDYIYQGDETMFKDVLQDKGYKGYLFLPNVDGDIGFFVEKYSGDI
ncbi:MAG TPA: hypothetical protein VLM81_04330, partial [Peptostreptococcaceae bacterium]|nr:hypothetical protein [Peptostreptococcaceae bacterium]